MSALKKPLPFHPFLFSILPTAYLLSLNYIRLQSPFRTALPPLLFTLFPAALAWTGLTLWMKNGRRAALFVSLFLVLFFSYGHARLLLLNIGVSLKLGFLTFGPNLLLLPVWLLLFTLGVRLAGRAGENGLEVGTRLLNASAVCLLLLAAGRFAGTHTSLKPFPPIGMKQHPGFADPTAKMGNLPDIYYIILDAYGREDVLRSIYSFDNSPFIGQLKARGFFVGTASLSNYSQTTLSLASSFNMTYLDEVADMLGPRSEDRRGLGRMLRNNAVVSALKTRGYLFAPFASGYDPSDMAPTDIQETSPLFRNEYTAMYLNTTLLPLLLRRFAIDSRATHRARLLYTLDRLPKLRKIPKPVFAFAHLLCPHPPFVFGENGEPVQSNRPFSLDDSPANHPDYLERYPAQVAFLNKKILFVVDEILHSSKKPVIIILQGDHGPGLRLLSASLPETLEERMPILNAIYFPDGDYGDLYDSITPVNTFRVVLNKVARAHLPLLKDRSFFSPYSAPYDFVEVDP